MNISARFAEFGMTGAFFWIAQITYVFITHDVDVVKVAPGWECVFMRYQEMGEAMPEVLKQVAEGLLTAFALIGIFVTGLILNLLGSYFFVFENVFFARHLDRNTRWMDVMMRGCAGAVSEDYQQIREEFGTKIIVPAGQVWRRLLLSPQCKRVQSFLFSYIHVFGDNGTPEMLNDHVHLWRTARAIGITFWFLCVEILVLEYHGSIFVQMGLAVLFILLAIYTTLRSYNRMCHTLFTMACATNSRQKVAHE